jgi:hypothetical protein
MVEQPALSPQEQYALAMLVETARKAPNDLYRRFLFVGQAQPIALVVVGLPADHRLARANLDALVTQRLLIRSVIHGTEGFTVTPAGFAAYDQLAQRP